MRVDGLIENAFKSTRLKRVRIKVDPSQLATFGYEHVTSFEGYILSENTDTVQVYVINMPGNFEPVQTVDKKHIAPQATQSEVGSNFECFKKKILATLDKENIAQDNPHYQSIKKSNNDEFLDTYLKNLGYDDNKIKSIYKSLVHAEGAEDFLSIAKDVAVPFLKKAASIAGSTASSYANIPKLIAGKQNIIGRVGRFIRSLNPRDLIDVDKYGEAKTPETTSVKNGDAVYITNLPFKNLKTIKHGGFEYQITGMTTRGIFEKNRKINKIVEVEPAAVDRELEFSLDFSVLGNNEKTGTLIMDFKYLKEPTRYYKVKVINYQGSKILQVIDKLTEQEGLIGNQIIQDEVRKTITLALEEFFNDKKPGNLGELVNRISDNILKKKERNLELFDKVMKGLLEMPEVKKSSTPIIYLNKELKRAGLL